MPASIASWRNHRVKIVVTARNRLVGIRLIALGSTGLTQMGFARILGLRSFGFYASATAVITLASMVGKLGFDVTLLGSVPVLLASKNTDQLRKILAFATGIVAGSGLLVGAVASISIYALGGRLVVSIACGLTAANLSVVRCHEGALRALGQEGAAATLSTAVWPVLSLLLFVATRIKNVDSVEAALFSSAVSSVVVVAASAALLRIDALAFGSACRDPLSKIWVRSSLMLLVYSLGAVILAQSDIVVVRFLATPEAAAQYAAAWRIAALIGIPNAAIHFAALPAISRSLACGDYWTARRISTRACRQSFGISLLLSSVLILVGKQIVGLFGSGFAGAYPILLILTAAQIAAAAAGPLPVVLSFLGLESTAARLALACAAVNLALSVTLGRMLGPRGVASGTLASWLVWMSLMGVSALQNLKEREARVPVSIATLG